MTIFQIGEAPCPHDRVYPCYECDEDEKRIDQQYQQLRNRLFDLCALNPKGAEFRAALHEVKILIVWNGEEYGELQAEMIAEPQRTDFYMVGHAPRMQPSREGE